MSAADKLDIILQIVNKAYEFEPMETQDRGRYYEGVICAIYGVLTAEENTNAN